jgi:pimeloyl-ACP methyl ester carboxylesterase
MIFNNLKDDNRHQDGIHPFPAAMQAHEIETNGITVHVRVGGHGPAVVMLHGFGTTGDMWGHLANALIEDHRLSRPTSAGWASLQSLVAATTRGIRRWTWWACWTP